MCPLYDFVCTTTECHEKDIVYEKLVQADEVPECEFCGLDLRKKLSVPAAFIFKGDGFYKPSSS
jgi:predicted nucleic acid-binding Zn ribbon protein